MIVQRWFYFPKPGRRVDLVELMQAEIHRFSSPHLHAVRLYAYPTGNSAQVSQELEFENHEESEKFWAAWQADPGAPAFFEKYDELVSRYWTTEHWDLIE